MYSVKNTNYSSPYYYKHSNSAGQNTEPAARGEKNEIPASGSGRTAEERQRLPGGGAGGSYFREHSEKEGRRKGRGNAGTGIAAS